MGVGITRSRRLLIWIGAIVSTEAQEIEGSRITFPSVFRILLESAESRARYLNPIVYHRLIR